MGTTLRSIAMVLVLVTLLALVYETLMVPRGAMDDHEYELDFPPARILYAEERNGQLIVVVSSPPNVYLCTITPGAVKPSCTPIEPGQIPVCRTTSGALVNLSDLRRIGVYYENIKDDIVHGKVSIVADPQSNCSRIYLAMGRSITSCSQEGYASWEVCKEGSVVRVDIDPVTGHILVACSVTGKGYTVTVYTGFQGASLGSSREIESLIDAVLCGGDRVVYASTFNEIVVEDIAEKGTIKKLLLPNVTITSLYCIAESQTLLVAFKRDGGGGIQVISLRKAEAGTPTEGAHEIITATSTSRPSTVTVATTVTTTMTTTVKRVETVIATRTVTVTAAAETVTVTVTKTVTKTLERTVTLGNIMHTTTKSPRTTAGGGWLALERLLSTPVVQTLPALLLLAVGLIVYIYALKRIRV